MAVLVFYSSDIEYRESRIEYPVSSNENYFLNNQNISERIALIIIIVVIGT